MKLEPKTFFVSGPNGKIEAEQLATFAHYIGGEQFRFVVTKLPHQNEVALTHRISGMRVTVIPQTSIIAAVGDYKVAAISALKALIDRAGEARVASTLRTAEVPSYPGV